MNFAKHYLNMPAEVMLNKDLTETAVMVWALVDFCEGEHGLIASNQELGDKIHRHEKTIGISIKLLENLGYLFVDKKGKDRILRVNHGYIKKYKHIKMRFDKMKRRHDQDSKSMFDEALGIK